MGFSPELKKKIPAFDKGFKMNDSYLEQKGNQPSARLEKYSNEEFDILKNLYNDSECQDQNFSIDSTNLEKVKKISVMISEEIIHCVKTTDILKV